MTSRRQLLGSGLFGLFTGLLPQLVDPGSEARAQKASASPHPPSPSPLPVPPSDNSAEVLHGIEISDRYRPLENLADPRVQSWVSAHDARARAYLDGLPARSPAAGWLGRLQRADMDVPRIFRAGGRTFSVRRLSSGERPALHVEDDKAGRRVLLDPNTLPDGSVALARFVPSPDGRMVACVLARAGGDRQWIEVVNVETGRNIGERLDWCRATTVVWLPDGSGFYYTRLPVDADPGDWDRLSHLVCRHVIGTRQDQDATIFGAMETKGLRLFLSTGAARSLLMLGLPGTSERAGLWSAPIETAAPLSELVPIDRFGFRLVGSSGNLVYGLTDLDAPMWRVIAIDRSKPGVESWRSVVPAGDAPIDQAVLVGGKLLVRTFADGGHRIAIWSVGGKHLRDVAVTPLSRIDVRRETIGDANVRLVVDDLRTPRRIERLVLETGTTETIRAPGTWTGRDQVEVTFDTVRSADGAEVPLTIVARKGVPRDGSQRTLLYGYGGFGVTQLPAFNPMALTWVMLGGVFAIASIRGGGERGRSWHDAGRRDGKPRTFDDFVAVAEWLIERGITRPDRLGCYGASNGGLTVLAAMQRKPELFGAVAAVVPLADMLRYHLLTVGSFWLSEYGDPADAAAFRSLLSYSPLHNVKAVRYPPLLVVTADNDDRVPPAHAYKFVARQSSESPASELYLTTEMMAGHGSGNSREMIARRQADVIAFLCDKLGGPLLDR